MRILILLVALAAAACAHVRPEDGTAGGEPLAASAPAVKVPAACAESLRLHDARRLLTFDERASLAVLDAACVDLADRAELGGRCLNERLETLVGARHEALGQAERAGLARLEGDVAGAQAASMAVRRLGEEAERLVAQPCPGQP